MGTQISGFGGLNSGLPVDDIIAQLIAVERQPINLIKQRQNTIKAQQNAYSTVQTKINDLLTSIKKLTTRSFDGSSIFDSMLGTSSDEKIATATATSSASPQSLSLEIKTLPTATKAVSLQGVGRFDNATKLSDLGVTDGAFTIYSNGTAYNFNVLATDDVGTVLANIQAAIPEVTAASIVDGKISLSYSGAPGTNIIMGSGGDTTNFLSQTHLLTGVDDDAGTITASQRNTTINTGVGVSDAAANLATAVTDGDFTINGVTFSTLQSDGVTSKSLTELITEINASNAKVTAKFNLSNNTFELVAKDTGSSLISLSNGSSNFLTAMGLIDGGGNTTTSQTAGTNSEFVLNGTTMFATTTTVDETITGLTGVTLDLKKAQPGTTVQINIQQDKDSLKAAVKDVVEKYNAAIEYIDQQTNAESKGILAGQTRLTSLRNQIRGMFTASVAGLSGTAYDSLQQVGISTGTVGSSAGKASPTLQFDESKFDAAMAADPQAIKQLFIAQDLGGSLDGTANDDNMDGTFTRIYYLLADKTYTTGSGTTGYGALYNGPNENEKGLFAAYQLSAQKRIDDLDKSIERQEMRLEKREQMLRQQFLAMDRAIGQYQAQGNALSGLIAQLNGGNNQ